MKPFVYLASPYSFGRAVDNIRQHCGMFDKLMSDDVVIPFAPLLSHFQSLMFPRTYEAWMSYDLEILSRCDAMFRQPGESAGADREEAAMTKAGKPVFHTLHTLYDWAKELTTTDFDEARALITAEIEETPANQITIAHTFPWDAIPGIVHVHGNKYTLTYYTENVLEYTRW